ncbi:MAG: hypothetical protein HQL09_04620 [Nitrospirae bacterium]|nr:hypothetical protein [Nitrospirota bacterium]
MEEDRKHSRVRSPGYPMIDLKEAIVRAKMLWDKDKNNPIPREVAAEHLGYGSAGGYPGRVLAALKHFDLIYMREGDIILTDKAVNLAVHSPSDKVYIDIVKEIALKPSVYADLFNEYNGDLPSDSTLKVKLIKDYKFNAYKIERFITSFRSTIEFAGLTTQDKPAEEEKDEMQKQTQDVTVQAAPIIGAGKVSGIAIPSTATNVKHYPIPLSKGKTAVIAFEALPIGKKDIDAIKKWLELFSDSLTETEDS